MDSFSGDSWSLGTPSSELSYYDGMIQLNYHNGTPYNDGKQTQRSTHITFLCDHEAGPGVPEYQVRTEFDKTLLSSSLHRILISMPVF